MTVEPLVPEPDGDDAAYWAALGRGVLEVSACSACGHRWGRPLPGCPRCGAPEVASVSTDGRGAIYSWVVVRRALDPAFVDEVPYTVVAVDLEGGGRVLGRLLDGEPSAGQHVALRPYEAHGHTLPGFVTEATRAVGA